MVVCLCARALVCVCVCTCVCMCACACEHVCVIYIRVCSLGPANYTAHVLFWLSRLLPLLEGSHPGGPTNLGHVCCMHSSCLPAGATCGGGCAYVKVAAQQATGKHQWPRSSMCPLPALPQGGVAASCSPRAHVDPCCVCVLPQVEW